MGRLLVVNHARSSISKENFDGLSPSGQDQAGSLGSYWAAAQVQPDVVYAGPLRRQQETARQVTETCRNAGLKWPDVTVLEELAEHKGEMSLKRTLMERTRRFQQDAPTEETRQAVNRVIRHQFSLFLEIARQWYRGDLTIEGHESWESVKSRIKTARDRFCQGRGQTVVVFASGLALALLAGFALDAPENKILDMSWQVRNTGFAEFRFFRSTLHSFEFQSDPASDRLRFNHQLLSLLIRA